MKKIMLVLVLFLLFPLTVFANENLEVKSITFVSKSENTTVASEATTDGEKINLDLIFYEQGDNAVYKTVVKNKASERLYVNSDLFQSDDNHISYEFTYTGNKKYIEPGEEQEITIKVTYKKAISIDDYGSGGKYSASTNAPLILSNKLISVPNTLKNLGLLGSLFIITVVICVIFGLHISYKNIKNKEVITVIIAGILLVVPCIASALLMVEIPIEATITIKKVKENPCTFEGSLTQGATFVSGQYTYKYKQQRTYDSWENITDDGWGMALTDRNSTDPVTSKMCTSINGKPIVSMHYTFCESKATSIDLSSFDTSNVKSLNDAFASIIGDVELKDIEYLDTSNVIDFSAVFASFGKNATAPINLDLTKWDTSNAASIRYAFVYFGQNSTSTIDLNISGWDLRGVDDINYTFRDLGHYGNIIHVNAANIKLNPTKITDLEGVFYYVGGESHEMILDVTGWDTSGVTTLLGAFSEFGSNTRNGPVDTTPGVVNKIIGLSTWDLRNCTNVQSMFTYDSFLDFGTINIYATNTITMFAGNSYSKGTVNIYANPTQYNVMFVQNLNDENHKIIVNYTSAVTSINDILATKGDNDYIIKGSLLDS